MKFRRDGRGRSARVEQRNRTAASVRGEILVRGSVEGSGLADRHAEALPRGTGEVFREVDNLADVVGVVSERAVDGLEHGERLAADRGRAFEVGGL